MQENITIHNKAPPFTLNLSGNKSFSNIKYWKFDKVIISKKKKRVVKVEIYNYFKNSDLELLIKYFNTKKFEEVTKSSLYPRIWNVILAQEGKNIIKGGKIVDISKKYYKYHYKVEYSRVLLHRNRTFLIKIYRNSSHKKKFFKLEITYTYFKKNYNLTSNDWIKAIKSINELIKKIEHRFNPIGFGEDYSKKITIDSLFYQVLIGLYDGKVNKVENLFKNLY